MDAMEDLYEPDEARPAKRVRLEAPLAITEEIQEEIVDDDDDWDDIYSNKATPQRAETPEGGVRLSPAPASDALPGAIEVDIETTTDPNASEEPIDEDDNLVARRETATIDEASNKILEETSQVEVGLPREDESGKQDEVESNRADDTHDIANAVNEASQNDLDGRTPCHVNGAAHDTTDESTTTIPKPRPEQDAGFMAAAAEQKKDQNAEWQFDPSDAESSSGDSDSSSDDSSEESESESEGGYEMLDPATAAKMLMSGDGEDDDGDKGKNKSSDHQPRTANEVKDEVVPKPDVVIMEDMKITHLGFVDRTVEKLVLVKAVTPGEYQVLESGSVLCNEKREVIGAVAETLGRVQEPMYSVAFTNEKEIQDMGLGYGAKVFYVDSHSTFVFTQPLKNLKGTDASNIHDEEVGEDEIEFSDDEKEAEYKRLKKAAKRGGRGGLSRSAFNEERGNRDAGASEYSPGAAFHNGSDVPQQQYGGGMNYDDGDVQDEFYSPLKRPDNLSQMMAGGGPPPLPNRGSLGGRGRGDRGRGRGDRGRGRGRGGFDHRNQRGGFRQDERRGGNFSQQNGQRGPAHSFPDRHNHGSGGGRANGRKHQHGRPNSNASQSSSPPPPPKSQQQYSPTSQQQYPAFPHQSPQHQAQPPASQTYQFNGYTFQYGNPPPPQMPQMPAAQTQIPAGAYVNPAFFQQQQQQQAPPQQQSNYGQWPPQQQYPQYAQPAAPAPQTSNSPDLAAILRQLGGYSQQQQQR